MTKQEIIKEAYGKYYPQLERCLDENGWSNNWNHFISVESRIFQPEEIEKNGKCWRPKSLEGLEDNNGWIKIESYQDLPKETGHYWVKRGYEIGINYIIVPESLNSGFLAVLTHYKPIEKTKPPIY